MSTTVDRPLYHVSVLGAGFARMWRGWKVILPVIVINAALQALLILLNVTPYLTLLFVLVAVISFMILVKAYNFAAAAMLQAAAGAVDVRSVYRNLWSRYWVLLAWSVGLAIVVLIGLSLYVIPGFLVLALTPYLLLAVVDGQRNPLAVNFRTIGARWGRWLITVFAMGVVVFVAWFFAALDGFFITGAPGSFIGWIVLGFIATWFLSAWSLIYRSVNKS